MPRWPNRKCFLAFSYPKAYFCFSWSRFRKTFQRLTLSTLKQQRAVWSFTLFLRFSYVCWILCLDMTLRSCRSEAQIVIVHGIKNRASHDSGQQMRNLNFTNGDKHDDRAKKCGRAQHESGQKKRKADKCDHNNFRGIRQR